MAGKHRARAEEDQQQQAYAAGQQAAPAPAPAPAPAAGPRIVTADDTARLGELGKLHEQGILTDEEFTHQKSVILGSA